MNQIASTTGTTVTGPQRRLRASACSLLCGAALGMGWLLTGSEALAQDAADASDQAQDKINYSVGYEFGRYLDGLKRQGTGVKLEAVFKGVADALSGAEPPMSEEEMAKVLGGFESAIADADSKAAPQPRARRPMARTRGFKDDFAALNAKREGVTTLPSGLQYEVLQAGTGKTPQAHDRVAVRYEGKLTTGAVFDTTDESGEPTRLQIDQIVVPGLREAILRMKEGDKWRVVVPPRLGFGRAGNNMLRKRDLIYEIELVSVEPSP